MKNQELNEKLAKWAGNFDFTPDGRYEAPDGEWNINFTESLDACFKWLVPKLRINDKYPYLNEIIIDPVVCDDEMYYVYLRYDSLHDDGCVEREEAQTSSKVLALALCLAIEKLIDEG